MHFFLSFYQYHHHHHHYHLHYYIYCYHYFYLFCCCFVFIICCSFFLCHFQLDFCVYLYLFTLARIPINFLLVNLAVSDIMIAIFLAPEYIFSLMFTHPDGVTGTVLCRLLTGGNFAWVMEHLRPSSLWFLSPLSAIMQ